MRYNAIEIRPKNCIRSVLKNFVIRDFPKSKNDKIYCVILLSGKTVVKTKYVLVPIWVIEMMYNTFKYHLNPIPHTMR